MYDAIDVARYVINYSQEIGSPVSNLKLQKILYFIQGIYLSTLDKPCFSDDIEAWGFGPVISDVYHEFKGFGSNDIPTITEYFEYNKENPWASKFIKYDDSSISNENKKLIDVIVNMFKDVSASFLVAITHKDGSPWSQVYNRYTKHIIIDNEAIKKYFKENYCK